jgi:hypothetical protein
MASRRGARAERIPSSASDSCPKSPSTAGQIGRHMWTWPSRDWDRRGWERQGPSAEPGIPVGRERAASDPARSNIRRRSRSPDHGYGGPVCQGQDAVAGWKSVSVVRCRRLAQRGLAQRATGDLYGRGDASPDGCGTGRRAKQPGRGRDHEGMPLANPATMRPLSAHSGSAELDA